MNPRAIILDFDGTIVESVGIKDQAFEALFDQYPEHFDEIMQYHLAHNATIRFDKFKFIAENILHINYTDQLSERWCKEFSARVVKGIAECPYVVGAIDFLNEFYSKIPLYLISVSPENELNYILEARDLKKYFKAAFAVSGSKRNTIVSILNGEHLEPKEALFIGDTTEDCQAALAAHVSFIGRNSGKSFGDVDVPICSDFLGIRKMIKELG